MQPFTLSLGNYRVLQEFLQSFTSRDAAGAVWATVVLSFALSKPDVRSSIGSLLKSFFVPVILIPVAIFGLQSLTICWLLKQSHLWGMGNLKDTIVWFIATSVVALSTAVKASHNPNELKQVAIDALKLSILLEFVLTEYTLSFWLELLVLAPLLAILTIGHSLGAADERHARATRLFGTLLAVIGICMFCYSTGRAIADWDELRRADTAIGICLAPILTLVSLPSIWLLTLYVSYESAFKVIHNACSNPSRDWVTLAKWEAVKSCMLSTTRLSRLRGGFYTALHSAKNPVAVREVVQSWARGTGTLPAE